MEQKTKTKRGTPEYIEKMRAAGRKGGANNVKINGREHMAAIGKKGGDTLLKTRGKEFYSMIGKIKGTKEDYYDVEVDSQPVSE